MSNSFEPGKIAAGSSTVHQIRLGDSEGNNSRLEQSLAPLAEKIGSEGPKQSYLAEALKSLTQGLWNYAPKIKTAIRNVIDAFTHREATIAKANAEANLFNAQAAKLFAEADVMGEISLTKAKAEAAKTHAEASVLRAKAKQIQAHAKQRETQAKLLQNSIASAPELRQQLLNKKISWLAEPQEDGTLRFIVVKGNLPELPPDGEIPKELPPT